MPDQGAPIDGAPGAAPMMTPQAPAGELAEAKMNVLMAVKVLERSLAAFGSTSKEGKAVLKSIKSLSTEFGADESQSEEMMPAELKQLLAGLSGPGQPPGGGGPPPGGPPGGGAPPGGPPPGMPG